KDIYKKITLSGKISGKINDLKGKKMDLLLGESTEFAGDMTLTGLPKIDETLIYLNVERLTTNYKDLSEIPVPPFENNKTLSVPISVAKLGNMKFKGTFTGLYNDFYAYGDFSSALGVLSSDLSVRHDIKLNKEFYKGKLKSKSFDFGSFLGAKYLGKATMDVDIDGSGLTLGDAAAELKGTINSVEFNKYTYQNIAIEGNIAKQIFKGKLNVKDDNIDFDFIGDVDLRNKLPKLDFITTINKADLAALHFVNTTKKTNLSTQLIINITGNNIDNFIGEINFDNTIYKQGDETFKVSVFDLISEEENGKKTIKLSSDFADGTVTGTFSLLKMPGEIEDILHKYLPANFRNTDPNNLVHENFLYNIDFKKTDAVTRLFTPGIIIAPKTNLKGSFTSQNDQLVISGSSPKIDLYGHALTNWTLSAESENEDLKLNTSCDRLYLSDSMWLSGFNIKTITRNDSINLAVNWDGKVRDDLYKGDVKSFLFFSADKKFEFKILPSQFVVADTVWDISKDNQVLIDTSYISVNHLSFEREDQSVSLNGIVSDNKNDQIKLDLNNFNLSNLNGLTRSFGLSLKGRISGTSTINDIYHSMLFATDVGFKSFHVNDTLIGDGDVQSVWDNSKEALYLHGSFSRGIVPNILFAGYYYPKKEDDNIDMELNLQAMQMEIFAPYVKDYCSEFSGMFSGNVDIKGNLKKPKLSGTINVDAKKVKVDYLNTTYSFKHDIIIENNSFGVENLTLYDVNNNKAVVTGKVYHDNFKNFQVDFDIQTNKFMCLNTTEIDNTLYYGKAYMTGIVNIFGFTDNILIDANVKTEKITSKDKSDKVNFLSKTELTNINIPLGGTSEVSQNNFITFIKKDSSLNVDKYAVQLGGVSLNFDVDVTPDAEIQLIFDQKVGDIIKARGNGNINLNISSKGDFKMYGDYVIENGDYLFTLQNIINKKFDIAKGSTIRWSGIPYQADLDIDAVYKARASLKPFFDSTTTTTIDPKKRYPIDLNLNMTGDLLSPLINFNIGIPTVDAQTRQTVLSYINNDAEVNRQVFSLLILNSFVTPYELANGGNGSNAAAGAAGANTSEMLSNQLSNMLSKISKDFDIGVNYRPGDAISKDELAVALSTQLFNDKLSIEGDVGNNPNSQSTNNIVGDVNVDYKITEDGKVRVKAFNKTNDDTQTNLNAPYTQGVGVFYREEFNTIAELYERYLHTLQGMKKPKKKEEADQSPPPE
ncbi:MAG: translocation/assembly module TamB domain-containing protein, partial [Bacteroidia bacterium]